MDHVNFQSPMENIRRFFRRHPILGDTLRWALPALLIGAVLRILLTSYLPYACWGGDAESYYSFAYKLFHDGAISLGPKRRYLYPILMVPVSLLPGGPLRWLPFFQHTFGLITLLPLAYTIRKTLVLWRFWIVPITVIYAGLPITIWCEHELLGDHLFFALFVWTFAGWIAWVSQEQLARSRRLFWTFFLPFALFILTKPHGRFVWPGIFVGFVVAGAWRLLSWKQVVALFLLLAVTPTVGSRKQGAWLFYDATFPLTQLDTPLHAEYKAEIRDLVGRYRRDIDIYHALQRQEPFYFLRDPGDQDACPLWKALGSDERLKNKIYMDLALEGIWARPDLFLYLGLQRVVFDANISTFGSGHFADGSYIESTRASYADAETDEENPFRMAFVLPPKGPLPTYETFQQKLEPAPGSWRARVVQACVSSYGQKLDFFRYPAVPRVQYKVSLVHSTYLGWWLFAAMLLSLLPSYRRTLGVWTIIALGYVFGVYLISVVNVHYIAPVWPMLLVLLAVPAEVILLKFTRHDSRGRPVGGRAAIS